MMKALKPIRIPGDLQTARPYPLPISSPKTDVWTQYCSSLSPTDADALGLSETDWHRVDLSDPACWSATNSLGNLYMTLVDAPLGQTSPPTVWTPNREECIFPHIMPASGLSPSDTLDPGHGIPTPPPSHQAPAHAPARTYIEPHNTVYTGPERVVALLLQRGVNVNVRNSRGQTPLHIAAQNGQLDVVRLLLASQQIDVNARDQQGSTPLHLASEKGHVEVVQLLVAHGARLDVRSGRTG
ncbi:ankyrin repeat-containing domain protein [Aspergillus leporis]|uniref:Ankyrin repeat-containing domain protein n=1 Tax=Aspergillus leporis TaxID=41062 RepID=A0A5N5XEW2_9EURO|nr:ankyrin repeat-containing domain protein [Aspergillus leporis]